MFVALEDPTNQIAWLKHEHAWLLEVISCSGNIFLLPNIL